MSSSTRNSNSPAIDKAWFHDTKTSCEKQARYFVHIRKLQDELINREQHNLINAMERLKQLSYPRRRPVIRNVDIDASSNPAFSRKFPARNLKLRKEGKYKAIQAKEQPDLNPVSGKPLIKRTDKKPDSSAYHHFFVMPPLLNDRAPLLNDRDIAKIVHNANSAFTSEPSTYLLQPHLPSIPNVGRKTTFMVDNRLKLLTLAESEFCEDGEGSVSGLRKHLHTGKSQRRKKSPKSTQHFSETVPVENTTRRGNVLCFDVDPNDPSLFSHCFEDKKEDDEPFKTTPLPPPNSRPSTSKSKLSVSYVVESEEGKTVSKADASKTEVALQEDSKSQDTVEELANTTSEVKGKMPDMVIADMNPNVNEGDVKVSDVKDLKSDFAGKDLDEVNDDVETGDIVQPVVTITNQPVPVNNSEKVDGS